MLLDWASIIAGKGVGYFAHRFELNIASQVSTVPEDRGNLKEALELFLETASATEIQQRLHEEVYVTQVEVAIG